MKKRPILRLLIILGVVFVVLLFTFDITLSQVNINSGVDIYITSDKQDYTLNNEAYSLAYLGDYANAQLHFLGGPYDRSEVWKYIQTDGYIENLTNWRVYNTITVKREDLDLTNSSGWVVDPKKNSFIYSNKYKNHPQQINIVPQKVIIPDNILAYIRDDQGIGLSGVGVKLEYYLGFPEDLSQVEAFQTWESVSSGNGAVYLGSFPEVYSKNNKFYLPLGTIKLQITDIPQGYLIPEMSEFIFTFTPVDSQDEYTNWDEYGIDGSSNILTLDTLDVVEDDFRILEAVREGDTVHLQISTPVSTMLYYLTRDYPSHVRMPDTNDNNIKIDAHQETIDIPLIDKDPYDVYIKLGDHHYKVIAKEQGSLEVQDLNLSKETINTKSIFVSGIIEGD